MAPPPRFTRAASTKCILCDQKLAVFLSEQPLELRRHEYFEGEHLDTSICTIGRACDVTRDLAGGTASAEVANPDD
jgi:hypothetical protein